jgi:nucleoside-specific outer membrane channel protein Tsx
MKSTSLALVGALSVGAAGYAQAADLPLKAPPPAAPAPFFAVSDTQLSYWHEFNAAEPGVGKHIDKDIVTITHFDAWKYGTNFVNIDFLKSDNHDPAAPWGDLTHPIPPQGIGDGALEVYGLFRSTFGLNEITNSKTFSLGWLKDISLYVGADGNTKNTAFAPQKRDVVAGIQFNFSLPFGGFLNVAPVYYKEWNHNGIAAELLAANFCTALVCTENVTFDGAFKLETNYEIPLAFLGPVRFAGYTQYTMPKGRDGFGQQTKYELHTDNRLVLDFGKVVGYKPNWIDLFAGYSYWQNKFGGDHAMDATGGGTESTAYVGIAWHAL